jgi:hypothetical protein
MGWVFVALLGIQIIESTHHHESSALEERCVVCQAVAHHPLDVAPPTAAPMVAVLFFLLYLPLGQYAFLVVKVNCTSYYSRAPPNYSA